MKISYYDNKYLRPYLTGVLVVIGIAITGFVLLRIAGATPFVVSIQPESGSTNHGAAIISDATASSGKAVMFKEQTGGNLTPANPNLSKEGRNVLAYLYSIEGSKILAGQQERDNCTNCESERLRTITGKAPAVHGHELAEYATDPMQEAVTSWNSRHQITTFSWHFGAPPRDDGNFNNSKASVDVNKVLQSGTNENTVYMAKLNKMAARLQKVEDANVPILWRPLHEMNGSWFWWSKSGPEAYKRLWIHMYNYFTVTKGLDNLIWVWSAALHELPNGAWYPGHQYVDITGSDTYDNKSNIDTWASHYTRHKTIAPSKPSALTETDLMPNPQDLINRGTKLIWFLPWYGQWLDENSDNFKRQVYTHSYVITADEMPDLR